MLPDGDGHLRILILIASILKELPSRANHLSIYFVIPLRFSDEPEGTLIHPPDLLPKHFRGIELTDWEKFFVVVKQGDVCFRTR